VSISVIGVGTSTVFPPPPPPPLPPPPSTFFDILIEGKLIDVDMAGTNRRERRMREAPLCLGEMGKVASTGEGTG